MNDTLNFCENCGAALTPGDRFCEACGAAVAPMAAHEPDNPPSPVRPEPSPGPGSNRRINRPAALFLALLVVAAAGFWLWGQPFFERDSAVPAAPGEMASPAPVSEPVESLPPITAETPPSPPSPPAQAAQAAQAGTLIEDWFASQPWFVELADRLPAGVTLQLFTRPDEDLSGATTVEVRENHEPDSGFDRDVSPLVGIFRVTADRSEILYLDVVEADYVPLERFLVSRYPPGPTGQVPEPAVTAPPAGQPAALPPVEIVYRSFMEEAFRSRGGNLRAGSPETGADRIEVELGFDGQTIVYVFVEIANDGQKAEVLTGPAEPQGLPGEGHTARVLVGPKDAGADRAYTLRHTRDGWEITGFTEGEH